MRRHSSMRWALVLSLGLLSSVQAQEIIWNRQLQGILDGAQLALFHGGMEYTKPTFADLDGDGDADLYVGEHDGYLNVFENLGGNPPDWYCVTTSLDSIDVGKQNAPNFWDVDLDGDLDLFMGEEDGNIWYYRNDGSTQSPFWSFQTGNYGDILVDHHAVPFFRDLEADGDDDLLVAHNNGGAAHFLNTGVAGSPTWSYQTDFYQGIDLGLKSSVCVFDVNGDTLQDLIMSCLDGGIYLYLNNGPPQNPTYADSVLIGSVAHNGAPAFCDLDSDGDLDMISGQSDGNLNYWNNSGSATVPQWDLIQTYFAFFDIGYYSAPALVDIDADGDLDLFVARALPGIYFLENVGTPDSALWHLASTFYEGIDLPGIERPAFSDLDADGDPDLVLGGEDGTLTYYQNLGTAQLPVWDQPVHSYGTVDVGDNSSPTFADVDADGDADLFIGSYQGTIHYLRNDGTITAPVWTNLGIYPGIDVGSFSVPAFSDMEGDGDQDMIIGNGGIAGNLVLCRNQGTPVLPYWIVESYMYAGWDFGDHASPGFGDIDGDGDEDLLVGCMSGGLYLMNRGGFWYDVAISLQPLNPPIIIPMEGGSFSYNVQVVNNESETHFLDVWTTLTTPAGETTLLDTLSLALAAQTVYNELRNQVVPDSFANGTYTITGYVGAYLIEFYDTDNFPFLKTDSLGLSPGEVTFSEPDFRLQPPHPNPFNTGTQINYLLPVSGTVELALFDTAGKRASVIASGWQEAGNHQLQFQPQHLASGIYFLQLKAGTAVAVQKVLYCK